MKKLSIINNLLRNSDYSTKIKIYMSSKAGGDDYDTYEQNYTFSNLNPITIKGYVSEISAESLVWKQYGLKEIGAKEVICEDRYINYFRLANKIEIDDDEYEVFKEGVGGRVMLQTRPFHTIRVILQKKT